MKQTPRSMSWPAAAAGLLWAASASAAPPNMLPAGVRGPVTQASYDGVTDDLLTAGLGKTGLMGATPAFADPLQPTPAELRRNAIYVNYRALVDYTAGGGMGVFYGPNIDADGRDTLGEGKIAGSETFAWADDGSGRENVTLMVQVPASFDPARACIVSATSSGSRGIYGAIGTAGEWGLKRGCAVAYTDKGTGNGLHELTSDSVTKRDGTLADADAAGREALFRAPLADAEREALLVQAPYRVAYKHAHSRLNPEADWGRHTLQAVRFAFWVLNERYGNAGKGGRHEATLNARNTIVIASSVSNGGGAALAAAEQDREGLIDGVAVSEPNAQPRLLHGLAIREGDTPVTTFGRPLADYFSYANLYQPCALLAPAAGGGSAVAAALWPAAFTASAQNRCTALAAKGLVAGATLAEQAADALARLHAYGWTTDADFLHQSHYRFATNAIVTTYTNAYGRFGVEDRLCGFTLANTDAAGAPAPQSAAALASIFSTGNGVPPTTGVNLVYDAAVGGPRLDFLAVSPSTGLADFALDGALCQRTLVTGRDAAGRLLTGSAREAASRVRHGVAEVRLDGRLRGKPVLIVAGRSDALLPVNHTARAYFAKTQASGRGEQVRYVEVTNAQHFDGFIALGALLGYDTRFVPLHVYFNRALDSMWAHLTQGTPLPPSQLVRTVPRGGSTGAAPALAPANVPPILATPAEADRIVFGEGTLVVPK
ncbi:D-(-)-3-hydroxybutyrate oligomer hydrolase [Rubrivivax gelatinosus]|nr:D-(-)-3-hydroxybutyrate oligomer hydrolase [Rubrivivax gelatinosus]